jgi:hypothetical protein
MLDKIPTIPAVEKFGKISRSPLNPSPLLEPDTDEESLQQIFKNTTSAVTALERKNASKKNPIVGFVKQLEKIGAVDPMDPNAKKMKAEFTQTAISLRKTGEIISKTNNNFHLWCESFESDEVTELSIEFSKFLSIHKAMNERFAERLEHIASRMQPVSKLEHQRNKSLDLYIKSKKAYVEFKKKSTDQHTITTLELQRDADYSKVLNDQALIERNIRASLRPALFAYVYCMKQSKETISFFLHNTKLNISEFEKIIKNEDSIYEAKLNLSNIDIWKNTPQYSTKNISNIYYPKKFNYNPLDTESSSSIETTKTDLEGTNNIDYNVSKTNAKQTSINETNNKFFSLTYTNPYESTKAFEFETKNVSMSPLIKPKNTSKSFQVLEENAIEENVAAKKDLTFNPKKLPNEMNNFHASENYETYVARKNATQKHQNCTYNHGESADIKNGWNT